MGCACGACSKSVAGAQSSEPGEQDSTEVVRRLRAVSVMRSAPEPATHRWRPTIGGTLALHEDHAPADRFMRAQAGQASSCRTWLHDLVEKLGQGSAEHGPRRVNAQLRQLRDHKTLVPRCPTDLCSPEQASGQGPRRPSSQLSPWPAVARPRQSLRGGGGCGTHLHLPDMHAWWPPPV